ncbi:MAG: N-acetylmuramoyl-L-alanine amidase [Methyloligellaceae bacterium]
MRGQTVRNMFPHFFRKACIIVHTIALACMIIMIGAGLSASAAATNQTIAKSARIGGDKSRTRLIVDLSNKVPFRYFTLADHYRVVIDMPNVRFRLPTGVGRKGRGLIEAFRYGLYAPGQSRIVIDVKGPVLVDKAFVLPSENGQPSRLVVDLVPTDRQSYLAKMRDSRKDRIRASKKSSQARKAAQAKAAPPVSRQSVHKKTQLPLVILDPGHGGIDSGAIGVSGTNEKKIVLQFSKLLRKELLRRGRLRVKMSRTNDIFVPLPERVRFARSHEADLFVSIHADSIAKRRAKGVRGATIYTLSEKASDLEAETLAEKENRSDIIAGVELPPPTNKVSEILIDLAQRETKNYSVVFANMLVDELKGSALVKRDPIRFANFRVLKAPDVPSVLLELGYLSSQADAKLLKSSKWRKKVAAAIAKAIEGYFKGRTQGQLPMLLDKNFGKLSARGK